jgi:hypothetical protein
MRSFCILILFLVFSLPVNGQAIMGSLDPGDSTRESGERYDVHTLEVEMTRKITVRMEAVVEESFDTYLIMRSPSGIETINDDFEGQQVSLIELWATETGTWTIWASQYNSEGGGAYSLTIDKGPQAKVEVIQGRLDYADQKALKGEYFDTHSWDASSSDPVIFEVLSLGFDGYLVVTAPDGQVWRNDDAGSTQLSRIGPVSGAGKWRIDVTSNAIGETGAYDLRLIMLPRVD